MNTKQKIILWIARIAMIALCVGYLYMYHPYTFGIFILVVISSFQSFYNRSEGVKKYKRELIFWGVLASFISILMVFPELNYLINDYQSLQ
ncbi:hypothetical protein EYV94_10680 [Puteibacter caeruleilacunae]|nr:hypothetical protein EYV94_10680 [Puteibacter caeruleilacunae]